MSGGGDRSLAEDIRNEVWELDGNWVPLAAGIHRLGRLKPPVEIVLPHETAGIAPRRAPGSVRNASAG